MKPIHVTSEIQKLKKVLVHRPGDELKFLTPNTLEELLFDDIPDLVKAQKEHDSFAEILRNEGVEVVYLEDLMAETLDANEGLRDKFLEEFLDDANVKSPLYRDALTEFYKGIKDTKEFVLKTMAGVSLKELGDLHSDTLPGRMEKNSFLALNPMPNLYFTRDPYASCGDNVIINHMFSTTRNRETIYSDYIFKNHPEYKGQVTDLYGRHNQHHIEGGDIFNYSKDTLFIGISQRTTADAIQVLAKNIFFGPAKTEIKRICAFSIPVSRAFMHLDTVFTQIDTDAFTYHPGIESTLQVFELTPDKDETIKINEFEGSLGDILARIMGMKEVRLFPCGGGDPMAAEREQWNDGSNTLTIAPGKVVVYKRNYVTNEMLKKSGINLIELDADNLTVGRGGPRCMSMPLVREDAE